MKVLVIDDNQSITELLDTFLNSKGFESFVTNDPKKGLEQIKEKKFDAILLDINMPEFSGIDIIETLEKEKILKDQNIHIFSAVAFSTNQIQNLLEKEGVKGRLKKPVQFQELLGEITCK